MGSWEWKGRAGGMGPAQLSPWGSPQGQQGGWHCGVLGRERGCRGGGLTVLLGTHHGAGSPHQQGHGAPVLLQQGDGGVSDLPVLALEDYEDGSPGKLQQPPEPFPARQGGEGPASPSPLPWELLHSYLKLLLHHSCSRYATESTTMRRRHRLTFMMRSADGSAGKGVSSPQVPVSPSPCPASLRGAYLSWAGCSARPGRACSHGGFPAAASR